MLLLFIRRMYRRWLWHRERRRWVCAGCGHQTANPFEFWSDRTGYGALLYQMCPHCEREVTPDHAIYLPPIDWPVMKHCHTVGHQHVRVFNMDQALLGMPPRYRYICRYCLHEGTAMRAEIRADRQAVDDTMEYRLLLQRGARSLGLNTASRYEQVMTHDENPGVSD